MLLPLFHNVLVLITAENLDAPVEGRVIEVGPQALYLLVGDVVRFGKYSGIQIVYGGVNCRLVRDEDILAIDGDEERKRRLGYNPRSRN